HTRCLSDWSSDVSSSDLVAVRARAPGGSPAEELEFQREDGLALVRPPADPEAHHPPGLARPTREHHQVELERRLGDGLIERVPGDRKSVGEGKRGAGGWR